MIGMYPFLLLFFWGKGMVVGRVRAFPLRWAAFRGEGAEPPRLLRSYGGLTYSAFPAGVFVLLSNTQLEAATYMKTMVTIAIKKSERVGFSIKNLDCSSGPPFN